MQTDYFDMLRLRWPLVLLAVGIACLAAWLTSPDPADPVERSSHHTAEHVLYQDPGTRKQALSLNAVAFLATTGEIPQRVADRLGEGTEPQILASQVSVAADKDLGVLIISSTQEDPGRAEALANTFAQEILTHFDDEEEARHLDALERTGRRLEEHEQAIRELDEELARHPEDSADAVILRTERDARVRQYGFNLDRYEELQAEGAHTGGTTGLYTLQEAVAIPTLPEDTVFTPPQGRQTRTGIAALVGLVLGALLVVGVERVDTRLRRRHDAEDAFRLPVLVEVPRVSPWRKRGSPAVHHPGSAGAESYRGLRLALQLMPLRTPQLPGPGATGAPPELTSVDNPLPSLERVPRVILVTSPGSGEGKTTTVANLGASFAEVGKSVLVVDCDIRQPRLHRCVGTSAIPGITDYLASVKRRSLIEFIAPTSVPGMRVLPSGSPASNPGELVGPMADLLAKARADFDVVIVDSPPVLQANDTLALAPRADTVIIVARSGRTTAGEAARTQELLGRIGAQMLGVALLAVPTWAANQYYRSTARQGLSRMRERQDAPEDGIFARLKGGR
jgi:capsular exopolysaccharide synthesis family protein